MKSSAAGASERGYWATFRAAPGLPLIMASVAAHMMMFGMLTPVMALYATRFGVADWAIGLMITVFAAGRLAADVPAGYAGQRFGLSALLWVGPAVAAGGSLLSAVAPSYELILFGRGLQGIGSGIYMTAATVYCATAASPAYRGRIMAMFQGALLVGAAMGPVVGGVVAELFGLTGPFMASAVVGAATAILIRSSVNPKTMPATREGDGHHQIPLALLLVGAFACVLLVNFAIFLTRTAAQWQMIPLLASDRFEMSAGAIGMALTVSALCNLAVLPIAGTVVDTLSRPAVIIASTLAAAFALATIALSNSAIAFWVSMAAMGVFTGLGGPAVAAYAVDVAPAGAIGPAMGFMRFCGDLGYLIGPLMLGALVDLALVDHAGAILVNAALLAAAALIFAASRTGRRLTNQETETSR